jgi:beta-glucanase (GH16 family)
MALLSVASSAVTDQVPMSAQASVRTAEASCTDGGGVRWLGRARWGAGYRAPDGVDRIAVDKVGWTTSARVLRTDSVVRAYGPDGRRVQTLKRTARFHYRNGTTYIFRNPRNPPNGPGKSAITVTVGKDGDGRPGCTMTFRQPRSTDYRLVWADEFSGPVVDRSRWSMENNSTFGETNNELACLTNRSRNVRQADGILTIHAAHEPHYRCGAVNRDYTSAMLHTRGHANWQYGRFEIRAQLPTQAGNSKGLWPAFWMRPTDDGLGELDVMEAVGSDGDDNEATKVHQTLHYDYEGTHPPATNTYTFPSGEPSDGFHTYATLWEPGVIRWYVDGALVHTRTSADTPWLTSAFSKPFLLRLNMAVGGDWPGGPNSSTNFDTADFKIDYVRVYQST